MRAPSSPAGLLRHVYCVLGSTSLPYSKVCLSSLLERSLESLALTLITDTADDRRAIEQELVTVCRSGGQRYRIAIQSEIDEIARSRLAEHPNVSAFRDGHPCWRKVTDAALLAEMDATEVILIDPDVYFPNYFTFEPTPASGIYLMWQRPNCLHPPEIVKRVFDLGIPLADHTDIGTCQFAGPLDWEWIDWFLNQLCVRELPYSMHIESIVWAALAMRHGGGYLCPEKWHCWSQSIWKRLWMRMRPSQAAVLLLQNSGLRNRKCIHAGGRIKSAIPQAFGPEFRREPATIDRHSAIVPFREYRRASFDRKIAIRRFARSMGLYRIVGEN